MHWWIATIACVCLALIIQYLCSSKILAMKQAVSMRSIALRDARFEAERLDEQEVELKGQQSSLNFTIQRLRQDIRGMIPRMKKRGLTVPQPPFPMEELELEEEQEG